MEHVTHCACLHWIDSILFHHTLLCRWHCTDYWKSLLCVHPSCVSWGSSVTTYFSDCRQVWSVARTKHLLSAFNDVWLDCFRRHGAMRKSSSWKVMQWAWFIFWIISFLFFNTTEQSPSLLKLRNNESLTFDLVDGIFDVFQRGVAMSSSGQPVAQVS